MTDNSAQFQSSLCQLVRCSPAARSFAEWLAGRSRGTYVTKVRVASQNAGVGYSEMVALFKLLETLGFGEFIEGRHGHESRMVWRIDIRSLAQGA